MSTRQKFCLVAAVVLCPSLLAPEIAKAMGKKIAIDSKTLMQEPATTPAGAKAAGPQPKIVFEEREYDFGEVKAVNKIEHIFKFRNEGKGELNIGDIKTSCGCTAALLSSKTIPPGGEGEIKSTFTAGSREGKQAQSIDVNSNDPAEPKVKLTIKGVIIPAFKVEPKSIYFADAKAGEPKKVSISQTLDEELKLGEITTRLNLVDASLREEASTDGKNATPSRLT